VVSKTRLVRIAERIREELSEVLLLKSSDPRLKGVTITDVTIDREMAYAEIYVCTIDGSARAEEVVSGLDHAKGFLRSELAHRLELRVFPKLRFHWDPTLERAEKIERLISSIHETDDKKEKTKKKRVDKNDASRA
jgi:ribosome-binding factor A